jgi:hypothetical protein
MNAIATITITALILALGGDLTEMIKKDRAALQGIWQVVASEDNGEKVPAEDLKGLFLIFQGRRHRDPRGRQVGRALFFSAQSDQETQGNRSNHPGRTQKGADRPRDLSVRRRPFENLYPIEQGCAPPARICEPTGQ